MICIARLHWQGHAGAVSALLKAGADPNIRDSYGTSTYVPRARPASAPGVTSSYGHRAVVKNLLVLGVLLVALR